MLAFKNIKMTEGPIFRSVLVYAIPLTLAGMLQIFFNAADLAVVGNFSGTAATAAVGATGSTISLIVNTVIGLSVGVNVLLSRSIGARDKETTHRVVHTALAVGLAAGLLLTVIGLFVSRPAMELTDCPGDSLEMAIQYMMIYFAGCPGILIYNFGSAILRTKGDTQRPLNFLVISGVTNVILNLLFVVVFHMAAAGVALATTISQYLAAFLTVKCLAGQEDDTRFYWEKLHIYRKELLGILRYGLPSGISNAMYSVSNIQIQTAVNSYQTSAVSGNAAAISLEGFVAAGQSALSAATVAFMGQNIGAQDRERVRKSFLACLAVSISFGVVFGCGIYLLGRPLLRIYLPNDAVAVEFGLVRLTYILLFYGVAGAINVIGGAIQTLGYSTATMINHVVGILGVRTVWMQLIYPQRSSYAMIMICYPITWTLILIANSTVFLYAYVRYRKKGTIR